MGRIKKELIETTTIFDKYRKHINSAKNKTIIGMQYGEAMEILRFVENKLNIKLGLSLNCSSCMLNLVEMFASLEEK